MLSLYSPPNIDLLRKSSGALWSCMYQGQAALCVTEVKNILSVVGVVPFPQTSTHNGSFYVVEQMGADIMSLSGTERTLPDEESL
jgi:hypothetical protein